MQIPSSPTAWLEIADAFETLWNFPHCVGAIDGKHILLQNPINSGSDFFNYKSQFSIVLLAVVDGNYNFLFADVGCQGRISDGGVFNATKFYEMMSTNMLNLPPSKELPGRTKKNPYFFAADSAFALHENIIKPYGGDHLKERSKRIFNYRLSRARRVVKNAFGIVSSVFRVMRKPILLEPNKAELVVSSTIYLHNYLRKHSPNVYSTPMALDHENNGTVVPGAWRNEKNCTSMISLKNIPKRSSACLMKLIDEIADYCINEGAVDWQTIHA